MRGAVRPVGRLSDTTDITKGAAIALVVLYHTTLFLSAAGYPVVLGRALGVLALFPMPLFFVVTGLSSTRQASWRFADLWRRRLLPILYLYVVWSLLRFAFFTAIPVLQDGLGAIPARSPLSLLLLPIWPSSSYWFLYALVLHTLASWALRKVPTPVAVGAAAVLSALVTSGVLRTGNNGWDNTLSFFVFTETAIRFAPTITARVRSARAVALLPLGAGLLVVSALLLLVRLRGVPGVILVGEVLAVAFGLVLARVVTQRRAFQPLAELGRRSLPVYLLHLFLVVPVAGVAGLLPFTSSRPAAVALQIVVGLGTILLAVVVAGLLARFRWLWVPPRALVQRRSRRVPPSAGPSGRPTRTPTSDTDRSAERGSPDAASI